MKTNKLHDAIYGLAIADAVGVPYEFQERGTFNCTDMIGYGSHNQPKGTFSDDTSMTLATLKSLKDNKHIDLEDIYMNFSNWLLFGDYAIDHKLFDIGNGTYVALKNKKGNTSPNSNGNGSLMRILPLAFYDVTDEEIKQVSAITHAHSTSMNGCIIYVHIAKRLLNGETIQDIIPTLKYEKPYQRLSIIDTLSIDEIRSTGYVVDTLEACLWVLTHTNSYKEAVLKSVNLGDDTDTVAAVTGGLAGIIYGLSEVQDWYDNLRGHSIIEECL